MTVFLISASLRCSLSSWPLGGDNTPQLWHPKGMKQGMNSNSSRSVSSFLTGRALFQALYLTASPAVSLWQWQALHQMRSHFPTCQFLKSTSSERTWLCLTISCGINQGLWCIKCSRQKKTKVQAHRTESSSNSLCSGSQAITLLVKGSEHCTETTLDHCSNHLPPQEHSASKT